MSNSTVFSLKADTKDLDSKLKAIQSSADAAFGAMVASSNKARAADQALNAELAKQNRQLDGIRASIATLNAKKAESGKLSKKEAAELKDLNSQLKEQKRANKLVTDSLREKLALQKRAETAFRAEANGSKAVAAALEKEMAARRKSTNESDRGQKSLHKEDAIRRSASNTLVRHIRRLESLAVAYFAVTRAYNATFGAGVQLNRQYENMELGLAALLASKTDAIDATGKEADALTKFNLAQEVTSDTMRRIKEAALDTPATFMQMAEFYQQAIGHALAAGNAFGSNLDEISNNTITLTKRLSSLGSSVGMQMDLVNEEIRSLMSGDVSRDSKLALILFGSPTVANAAIKEAKTQVGGLTKLFDEALAPFAVLEKVMTFDKQLNHLVYQIEEVQRAASKPVFDDLQESFKNLTEYLKVHGPEITASFIDVYQTAKVAYTALADAGIMASEGLSSFDEVIGETTESLFDFENTITGVSAVIAVMVKAIYNMGIVATNSALGLEMVANYFLMTSEEYTKYVAETDKTIQKNWGLVQSLDDLTNAAEKAGIQTRQAFAVMGDAKAAFDAKHLSKGAENNSVVAMFNAIEEAHTDLTEKYKGNTSALGKINDKYYKTLQRLVDEYTGKLSDQLLLKQKLLAAGEADKKALEDRLKLMEKLQGMVVTSRGDPYEALDLQRAKLVEEAKGNAQAMLLIDEWYIMERQKLYDKDQEDFNKRKELSLKDWEDYYKAMGELELAWYTSDERNEAFDNSRLLGLTDAEADAYIRRYKENYLDRLVKQSQRAGREIEDTWETVSKSMYQSMEDNFFDLLMGKFDDLGEWAEQFGKDLVNDFMEPTAKDMSKTFSTKIGSWLGLDTGVATEGGTDAASASADTGDTVGAVVGVVSAVLPYVAFFKALSGWLWGSGGLLDPSGKIGAGKAHDTMKYGAGSMQWGQTDQYGNTQTEGGYGWIADFGQMLKNIEYWSSTEARTSEEGMYMGGFAAANPIFASSIMRGMTTGHIDPISAGIMAGVLGTTRLTGSGLSIGAGGVSAGNLGAARGFTRTETSSWFGDETEYQFQQLSDEMVSWINTTLESVQSLLTRAFGVTDQLMIEAGVYFGDAFIERGVPRAIIRAIMEPTFAAIVDEPVAQTATSIITTKQEEMLNAVYEVWSDYADEVGSTVIEAMSNAIAQYTDFTRGFQEWGMARTGDDLGVARFRSEYMKADLDAILASMGLTGVTVDNYLSMYEEALAGDFTPEMLAQWEALGQALMASTDAATAYQDALLSLNGVMGALYDPMLAYVGAIGASSVSLTDLMASAVGELVNLRELGIGQLTELIRQKQSLQVLEVTSTKGVPLI